ncbi:MAG: helix-turn-helix domain-containing protein [Halobacteriales archaeon]
MGIRAELKVSDGEDCPVAGVSSTADAACNGVAMATAGATADSVTEEFVLDSATGVAPEELDDELAEVFSYGDKRVYRFDRSHDGCICERIERLGCPVTDVHARDGVLYVTFHTTGMEQLREVLGGLREEFSGVTVKRLLHSSAEDTSSDLVLLDRSELTARQREVLETAHRMGYFEHGQGANAGEVAEALDINTSTFSEHLRAAQRKLLRTILDT